jgi:hypothetical protein
MSDRINTPQSPEYQQNAQFLLLNLGEKKVLEDAGFQLQTYQEDIDSKMTKIPVEELKKGLQTAVETQNAEQLIALLRVLKVVVNRARSVTNMLEVTKNQIQDQQIDKAGNTLSQTQAILAEGKQNFKVTVRNFLTEENIEAMKTTFKRNQAVIDVVRSLLEEVENFSKEAQGYIQEITPLNRFLNPIPKK